MTATLIIHSIVRDDYLVAVVAVQNSPRSADEFHTSVRAHMGKPEMMRRLQTLLDAGAIASMKDVRLTPKGWQQAEQRLGLQVVKAAKTPKTTKGAKAPKTGKDSKGGRTVLTNHVFPALALGFRPDTVEGRRILKSNELRAVLLTRIFQLPLDARKVTLAQALGALVKRGLAGLGPAPMDPRLAQIASSAKDLTEVAAVRAALLTMALEPQMEGVSPMPAGADGKPPTASPPDMHPPSETDAAAIDAFARRVSEIAAHVSTPPFAHKASIAQVYDAYGRKFPDAGALHAFQARLLSAHMAGLIHLLPLDQPGALAPDAYRRSRVETPDGPAFFIDRGNVS
jgi:hypothetical protein